MDLQHGRPEDAHVLTGLDFILSIGSLSQQCRQESLAWLGDNAEMNAVSMLCGDTLSLLDRAASCWWGCSGKSSPHAIEHILGGSESAANAAISLALEGSYDESIGLVRSIAERANLLTLFVFSVADFGAWIRASDQERFSQYAPVKVRVKLEGLGHAPPFAKDHYQALSGRGLHAGAIPQVYSPHSRPAMSGFFQAAGLQVCLSELAIALGFLAATGIGILSHLPIELRMEVVSSPRSLVAKMDEVGGVTLLTLHEYLRKNPSSPTRVPAP
jgi:hypothetical protein